MVVGRLLLQYTCLLSDDLMSTGMYPMCISTMHITLQSPLRHPLDHAQLAQGTYHYQNFDPSFFYLTAGPPFWNLLSFVLSKVYFIFILLYIAFTVCFYSIFIFVCLLSLVWNFTTFLSHDVRLTSNILFH